MKATYLILLGLFCLPFGLRSHSPDLSSTMLVQQAEEVWVFQVRAALTAFDYAVEQRFGEDAYGSPEEFRALVLEHLRDNIAVRFDEKGVAALESGRVALGHETTATFRVTGLPGAVASLEVINTSFSALPQNQSALMVLKEGFTKKQFMLSDENDHTAKLQVSNAEFILVAASTEMALFPFFALLSITVLLGAVGYALTGKKQPAVPFTA